MKKIIDILKQFLNKIFIKDNIKLIGESKETEETEDTIKKDIKTKIFGIEMVEKTNEEMRLLSLQKKIENRKIQEEQLEENDIAKLKILYCKQILELNNKLETNLK